MKNALISCIAIAMLMAAGKLAAEPIAHLVMHSEVGDPIGGGVNGQAVDWDITYMQSKSKALAAVYTDLRVSFSLENNSVTDTYSTLEFSTTRLGTPLAVGTYLDATSSPFTLDAHPGLAITFQHRASFLVTGKFTITELTLDASNRLATFAVNFEQHSSGNPPALLGTFTYNSGVVPEPSTFGLLAIGGIGICLHRKRRLNEPLAPF